MTETFLDKKEKEKGTLQKELEKTKFVKAINDSHLLLSCARYAMLGSFKNIMQGPIKVMSTFLKDST